MQGVMVVVGSLLTEVVAAAVDADVAADADASAEWLADGDGEGMRKEDAADESIWCVDATSLLCSWQWWTVLTIVSRNR